MDENRKTLQQWVDESSNIVFFGGAGMSTESGVPDFRSKDGLYNQCYDEPPETIISHSYFVSYPDKFYRFYRDKMMPLSAEPNVGHLKLAELEAAGKLRAVLTQNIDGLHQKAGSKEVLELHGSIYRNYCMKCGKFWPAQEIADSKGIPWCDCGGMIKPDVVLYEEALDNDVMRRAIEHIRKADMMIVAGSSLVVYPAAGLINYMTPSVRSLAPSKCAESRKERTNLVLSFALFGSAFLCLDRLDHSTGAQTGGAQGDKILGIL